MCRTAVSDAVNAIIKVVRATSQAVRATSQAVRAHPKQFKQHPKQFKQPMQLEQPVLVQVYPNKQPVLVQKHAIYQPIRLAQLDRLIAQPIFSQCVALLTPVATFGCVSVHGIVHQCAFCSNSIPLAEVVARFTQSRSPRCTMELLATLSKEHNSECRAMKVVDRLNDDDVQFGISEGNIDIDPNILSFKGAQ